MPQPPYLHSAQVLRVVAIFAVVVIHSAPFARVQPPTEISRELFYFLNTVGRFAIPFFFILSGYFFRVSSQRREPGPAALGTFKRVLLIYLVWSVVFAFLPRVREWRQVGYTEAVWNKTIGRLQVEPLELLFSGTGTHLWFLAALALSVAVAYLFIRLGWLRALLPVTGLFYGAGLLGGLYNATPLGLDLFMEAKLGPFGGPFLFALGIWQADRSVPRKDNLCFLLIALGMGLILAEMQAMRAIYDAPQADFYLGSVPAAVGLLRFCVAYPDWGKGTVLIGWARYTLGVYVVHTAVLRIPRALDMHWNSVLWQIALPVLIYGASLAFCMLLSRSHRLARVVT